VGEDVSVYVQCYRCLICNELYPSRERVIYYDSNEAENSLFNVIGSRSLSSQTHYCDDGNVGLGLLAGFVLKISEDD
jgi:hypothetical protein